MVPGGGLSTMLVKVFRVLSVREGDPFSTMLLVVFRVFSVSGDGLKSMLLWLTAVW